MNEQLMLGRCHALLIAMIGKDAAPRWWSGQNKAFDMQTPEEVWKTEPEKVYNYLMEYASK
jgi:hypothetical protein